jgi:hypothetical protein
VALPLGEQDGDKRPIRIRVARASLCIHCAAHRPVVRFDLDETERPYAQTIADEIEATYGFEPMPPETGNVLVEEVEIEGVRHHYFGKGTIYDYLFTISW